MNGSRKSPRSRRLGTSQKPHRTTRMDGIHQFLLTVHRRIFKNCMSPERTHKKGDPLGMDQQKRRSLPKAQKTDLRGTSTPHAKVGTTIRTRSGRITLHNRSDTQSERRTQTMAPSSLLLHNTFRNGEKLRHLRQRVISSREVTSSLEDLPGRSTPPDRHLHRPFQPTILEGTSQNQSKNHLRIPRATRVQLCTQTRSQKQKHMSRCSLSK